MSSKAPSFSMITTGMPDCANYNAAGPRRGQRVPLRRLTLLIADPLIEGVEVAIVAAVGDVRNEKSQ